MKKFLKIFAYLGAGLLLLFAVALAAFYHLIQVGEFRRFLVSEFEQHTGLKVEVGEAEVEMGRVVGVSFRDFTLREPEQGRPVITASRIVARVALLPLLERKLVFYGVRLYEPRLQVARDEQGKMPWLDPLVNLSFHRQQDAQFSIDLREIRIDKGDVAFVDHFAATEAVTTRFHDIDLNLQRMRTKGLLGLPLRLKSPGGGRPQEGIRFKLRTLVDRSGRQTDLAAAGRALFPEAPLDIRKAWIEADLESKALPAAFLWDYYGRPLADAAPRGNLAYGVRWEGSLSEGAQVKGEVRFAGLETDAESLFPSALKLGDGRIDVALDWKPREVRIQRADLRSSDLVFALQGSLDFPDGRDPQMALHLTTPFLSLAAVRRFVPVKLFNSPRLENLLASIRRGEIKLDRADVSGKLSELGRLFEPGQEQRLSLEARVREMGGDFGADPPLPLRGFSGQIVLEKGVLRYKNFTGLVGQSRLTEINGTHGGALSGAGQLELRIKGDTELAQFSEMTRFGVLPPAAAKMAGAVQELGGGAKLDLTVRTDFASSYEYEGVVSLDAVHARFGETTLSELKGDLMLSPTEIRSEQATALLGGSPIQLRLQLKNFAADQGTFDLAVESSGLKASEALRLLLSLDAPQSPGVVRGAVHYQGSLAAPENRKLTGSLELVGVQIPLKVFSQPFNEVHGRVRLDGKAIDLQGVRAQAGGYPFTVNGRWVNGERPMLLFSLSAPDMDVAYLLPRHVTPDQEWYDRLQVRGKIILDKGRYEKFVFSNFKSDLVLEKRIWRLENVFARSDGGTIAGAGSFDDHPEKQLFGVAPDIKSVPVKDLLGWFDVGTTEITGKVQLAGKLEFSGKSAADRKRNLNGAFRLRIEDGVARRFQLMVRILSFLDLSRWFTLKLPNASQEGIHFRSISADVKVAQGVYSTQNLFVDGEDLRITGAGELDGPKGEINFVIAARPFPGLDTAANYIPILGTGLAAIKNSFLVASFNVRGPINDPTITPAPLSTLSEYFFGVLAIPKGLIGLPTSGEPKPNAEPKPAPDQTPAAERP
jgi:uncharacterized protein YhdP